MRPPDEASPAQRRRRADQRQVDKILKWGEEMTVDTAKTVRELAVEIPSATRVFEKLGIDYCCGGHRTLDEACQSAKLSVETVVADLATAENSRETSTTARDWSKESLSDLMAHICSTHHVFVKNELPRLGQLVNKVASKHGPSHPETAEVLNIFAALAQELTMHLMKEEQILFPYVERMEEARIEKTAVPPSSCFGTVQNPIHMMEVEHDGAGEALRRLREVTNNYKLPEDACMSYKALYQGLIEFEADLHQHIHLENNILHPRAIAMEQSQ
ncbi:MAG TPA: iron-sulfur cluster repair di-iron protein [Candidatus Nanoarchaeia archaeon]|nr:iron-sulfur cluster repair di-iron protein [Candidatus Nanoarchaeia archaeon]